jgi:hypothetical protein
MVQFEGLVILVVGIRTPDIDPVGVGVNYHLLETYEPF